MVMYQGFLFLDLSLERDFWFFLGIYNKGGKWNSRVIATLVKEAQCSFSMDYSGQSKSIYSLFSPHFSISWDFSC